jgi:citrate synthase
MPLKKNAEKRTHLTATEAAQQLGVTEATLYAYVSRGLIRSEDCDGSRRTRKYSAEDVFRLSERKEMRKNPDKVAENALSWGAPILESAITLITEGHLFYRGYDAIELAQSKSFEDVISLLWTGYFPERGAHVPVTLPNIEGLLPATPPGAVPLDIYGKAQQLLPLLAGSEITMHDLRPKTVAFSARKIMHLLVQLAAGREVQTTISESLMQSWAPNNPFAARLFDAALVLSADHELDPSTFTARCVASTRSHPCAVVGACLSALQGHVYREKYFQCEKFLADVYRLGNAREAVASWLKAGLAVPCFGHPLYPGGDPRAKFLLETIAQDGNPTEKLELIFSVVDEVGRVFGEHPNLEIGLVAITTRLALDLNAARTLFMIGRSAGWMAHAIEQYQVREFFRPRARYVGDPPRRA